MKGEQYSEGWAVQGYTVSQKPLQGIRGVGMMVHEDREHRQEYTELRQCQHTTDDSTSNVLAR